MTNTNTTHTVLAWNLSYLLAQVETMNKRAKKLGCAPIVVAVLGSRQAKRSMIVGADEFGHPVSDLRTVSVTDLQITGETPRLNGWALVGTVEHTAGGNLVRSVPGCEVSMAAYRDADPQGCDHCNVARRRNDTFVVTHTDGRIARVGRSCLADYLGHKSVDALVWFADALGQLAAISESGEDFCGGGHSDAVSLVEYLAWVAQSIGEGGWISRGMAREREDLTATADDALINLREYSRGSKKVKPPTDADRATAAAALAFVAAELHALPGLNDYQSNLRVIITNNYTTSRQAGFAASIVNYHARAISKAATERAQAAAAAATSKHVGAVGDKVSLSANLVRHSTSEGNYGTAHIYSFVTVDGDVVVWFASRSQDINVGDRCTVRGTVKKLGEYKGTAQTTLTRCKLADVVTPAT